MIFKDFILLDKSIILESSDSIIIHEISPKILLFVFVWTIAKVEDGIDGFTFEL